MIDKKNPTILQMVLVLMLIAMICTAGVAAVFKLTEDTIKEQAANKEQKMLSEVLPEHDNDPTKDTVSISIGNNKSVLCYIAKKGNETVGYAIKANNKKGYNGKVEVLVGFKPNGTIVKTSATVLNETPGLGSKAAEPKFADQFKELNPAEKKLQVTKDDGDIDAISAATITSRAYTLCVATAYNALQTYLGNDAAKIEANSGATSSANYNADERAFDSDTLQTNADSLQQNIDTNSVK